MLPPAGPGGKCPAVAAGCRASPERSWRKGREAARSFCPLPAVSLHLYCPRGSREQLQGPVGAEADALPEEIQPPHGGCWIIKGCPLAAGASKNLTPHFPLCLGQRGLQPRCPEGALSSPGTRSLASLAFTAMLRESYTTVGQVEAVQTVILRPLHPAPVSSPLLLPTHTQEPPS